MALVVGILNNTLVLPEVASIVPLLNHGQIFTKNDNKLYFTDGANAEHELAFSGVVGLWELDAGDLKPIADLAAGKSLIINEAGNDFMTFNRTGIIYATDADTVNAWTNNYQTLTSGFHDTIFDSDNLTTGGQRWLGGTNSDKEWFKIIKNVNDTEGCQVIIDGDNVAGSAATPSLRIGSAEQGIYSPGVNQLKFVIAGTARWGLAGDNFSGRLTGGANLSGAGSSSTVPAFNFVGDGNTGTGRAAADQLSLIAGGVEGIRISESVPTTSAHINVLTTGGTYGVNDAANNDYIHKWTATLNDTNAGTAEDFNGLWLDLTTTNMSGWGGEVYLMRLQEDSGDIFTIESGTIITFTGGSISDGTATWTGGATNTLSGFVSYESIVLTSGANTFSLTTGTASLDIAAGATLDVNANLTVESASAINQDVTTDALAVAFGSLNLGGAGATPTEFSTDTTMGGNSDLAIPTEKAVKAYVDNHSPIAHKNSHDPNDGSDSLDTANALEISVVIVAGTGTSHSFSRADHVHAISHAITDNHIATIDGATNSPVDNDYAKWTTLGLEGMTYTQVRTDLNVADGADVTANNAPQAHKNLHDPNDGADPLDTANAAEISVVVAAGTGVSHSFARADHIHQIQHSLANNHLATIDGGVNAPVNTDIAAWTANGLEGRNKAQMLTFLNVDDGADVTGANAPQAHTHNGNTLQFDAVNSNGGAFSFTTSGLVTFSQSIASANYSAGNLLTAAATNAGEIDFTASNKKLDVEDNSVINQDVTTDATPEWAAITISSANPTLTFKDTDCAVADANFTISAQATDTGNGTEDINVTFMAQVAGVNHNFLVVDADGPTTFDIAVGGQSFIFSEATNTFFTANRTTTIYTTDADTVNAWTNNLQTLTSGFYDTIFDSENLTTGGQRWLGGTNSDKEWFKIIKNTNDTEGCQVIIDGDNVTGSAATPSLTIGTTATGFYVAGSQLVTVSNGTLISVANTTGFRVHTSSGPIIRRTVATATNPAFVPKASDLNTGMGSAAADQLSLIAGGVEGIRIIESGNVARVELGTEIGNGDVNYVLNVSTTSQLKGILIQGTHVDDGPALKFDHQPTAGVGEDEDILGRILFSGDDGLGGAFDYGKIDGLIDSTGGAPGGKIIMSVSINGAMSDLLRVRPGDIQFPIGIVTFGDSLVDNYASSYSIDATRGLITENVARLADTDEVGYVFRGVPHDSVSDDFMSAWVNMMSPTILHSEVPWFITVASVTVEDSFHGLIKLESAYNNLVSIRTMQKSFDPANNTKFGAWIDVGLTPENFELFFEITDTVGGGTDYVRLYFHGQGAGGFDALKWYGVCDDGTGPTLNTDDVAVTDGKHFLYVDVVSSSEVRFFVDGTYVGQVLTDIPADTQLYLSVGIKTIVSNGNQEIHIDKIFFIQDPDTGYW